MSGLFHVSVQRRGGNDEAMGWVAAGDCVLLELRCFDGGRLRGGTMSDLKAGDILGFSGDSWWSAGINIATYGFPWWSLSHVGIIAEIPEDCLWPGFDYEVHWNFRSWPPAPGTKVLFESTRSCSLPCIFQNEIVRGVQGHKPADRIAEYRGKVWRYPMCRELRPLESERLTHFLLSHLGRNYDALGAFRAGGIGFSWLESRFRPEDLTSLFCSEYVAAAQKHIRLLHGSASRWSPNLLVRKERREGLLLKPRRMK